MFFFCFFHMMNVTVNPAAMRMAKDAMAAIRRRLAFKAACWTSISLSFSSLS